ncbi:hypothetical protein [Leyella stercorea]|nr:hypothetical protein [Leyella stercorea]
MPYPPMDVMMAAWVWQDAMPSYECDDGSVGMARCHTLLWM